ncbi:MAG: sugar phosphate isomerase/epimerase, partial [Planctomycetes bacterium]|nr:sugar phosphate isomerase/epimerase [Planctomycetota bacterium]
MAGHEGEAGRLTRREALGAIAGAAALGGAPLAGAGESRTVKGRIKQSLSHWCFKRVEMEDLAREAARIGYRSIEMSGADTWPTIKKHGLAIAIVGGHGTLTNGLNFRENHDRIERELRRNIDTAVENGIPSLICFSGNRGGISEEEGAKNTADGLKRVAGYAEEKKITLCMELLNSKVNHKDYQADHTAWGVDVCKRVGSPRVKLLYDTYHMQIMEG